MHLHEKKLIIIKFKKDETGGKLGKRLCKHLNDFQRNNEDSCNKGC